MSDEKMPITIYSEFTVKQRIRFVLSPAIIGELVCIRIFGSGGIDYEVTYIDCEGQIKSGMFHDYEIILDED